MSGPDIEPTPTFLTRHDSNHLHRGTVGAKPVRHDGAWPAIALQRPFQKLKRSPPIPPLGGEDLEHLAVVIRRHR